MPAGLRVRAVSGALSWRRRGEGAGEFEARRSDGFPRARFRSYAVLGLLAIRPWSRYELTQQMDRSPGRFWPRAVSKLYEEPKKLAAHGLARSSAERNANRTRTVYAITEKDRAALAAWLRQPGDGPCWSSSNCSRCSSTPWRLR